MGMGYGYGSMEDLAEKRRLRLEARYGTPPAHDFVPEPEPVPPLHALEDATPQRPEKKKAGRPKGSKNKAAP